MIDARSLRTRLGWSQKDVAEYIGCDQATVSRIENGQEPSGPIGRMFEVLARDLEAGRVQPKPPAEVEPERAA